ncbi:VCBS repeat-containing protein [Albimonas donghaensis]|uniref:VCBS repeat-containing protein n=1 Tax=Albimonas donghaensis TaxID=356660 RepID=A0A1H3AZK1_9RHOB|nr:Ig-like domain-containing protein [Albimonas donghaensis]SDX35053.1 VCBS repeat-containing protein [Albimonas donghaensis]
MIPNEILAGPFRSDLTSAPLTATPSAAADSPPIARADTLAAHETALISGNLFDDHGHGADTDPEGGALRVVAVQGVASYVGLGLNLSAGRVRVMEDGKFWFDTAGDFGYLIGGETVEVSFDYTIADAAGATSTATATVTVTGANNAPTLYPDFIYTHEKATTKADVFAFNGLGADKDPEGGALRVVDFLSGAAEAGESVSLPQGGVVKLEADGTLWFRADGAYDHLKVGELAQVTFTYSATDGQFTRSSHVTLMIEGRNTAPEARDDAFSVIEDGSRHGWLLDHNGAGADSDIEGDVLTVFQVERDKAKVDASFDLEEGGRVRVTETGEFWFNPDGDFDHLETGETETVSFTYTIFDGADGYSRATVEIEVEGFTYLSKSAEDDSLRLSEGRAETLDFLANDYTSDTGLAEVVSVSFAPDGPGTYDGPLGGTLTLKDNMREVVFDTGDDFEYLKNEETVSFDFDYEIEERGGDHSTATVTVEVVGRQDTPTAVDDHFVWSLSGGNPAMNVLLDNGEGADFDVDAGEAIIVHGFKPATYNIFRDAGTQLNLHGGGAATISEGGFVTLNASSTTDRYVRGGTLEAGDTVVLDYRLANPNTAPGEDAQVYIDIIA